MATKAASLARELKSIKSDLYFMHERCSLLEEENRRLRDGFVKGIRPEEDDLVRHLCCNILYGLHTLAYVLFPIFLFQEDNVSANHKKEVIRKYLRNV